MLHQKYSHPQKCAQGLRKPRGSSEDNDELEGASDGEVGADLDDCEDHEEDLEMTAAAGEAPQSAATMRNFGPAVQSSSRMHAGSTLSCLGPISLLG